MLTYSFWLFEAQRVVYCVESLSMVVSEISSQFKILFRYDQSNGDNCESTVSPKSNQQYAKHKTTTFHKSSLFHMLGFDFWHKLYGVVWEVHVKEKKLAFNHRLQLSKYKQSSGEIESSRLKTVFGDIWLCALVCAQIFSHHYI